jgi:hypothetical protein
LRSVHIVAVSGGAWGVWHAGSTHSAVGYHATARTGASAENVPTCSLHTAAVTHTSHCAQATYVRYRLSNASHTAAPERAAIASQCVVPYAASTHLLTGLGVGDRHGSIGRATRDERSVCDEMSRKRSSGPPHRDSASAACVAGARDITVIELDSDYVGSMQPFKCAHRLLRPNRRAGPLALLHENTLVVNIELTEQRNNGLPRP